ncbi:MAG: DUF2017 domain-containing protein [Actinomycetia bacterium]|nr:DUF2017 domain-containing protein [Actinomycetes bacterium]
MSGYYHADEQIWLQLDEPEAEVLASLVDQLQEMVRPGEPASGDPLDELVGIDAQATPPPDAAQARLFPDAYREDPEAADEFRRFTERELRAARLEQIAAFRATLSDAVGDATLLDQASTAASLGVLNDLRLVLGTRLGLQTDEDNEPGAMDPEDPRQPLFAAYHWLTWLQSQLLAAMHPDGF